VAVVDVGVGVWVSVIIGIGIVVEKPAFESDTERRLLGAAKIEALWIERANLPRLILDRVCDPDPERLVLLFRPPMVNQREQQQQQCWANCMYALLGGW
jgi:hypothetical protein